MPITLEGGSKVSIHERLLWFTTGAAIGSLIAGGALILIKLLG